MQYWHFRGPCCSWIFTSLHHRPVNHSCCIFLFFLCRTILHDIQLLLSALIFVFIFRGDSLKNAASDAYTQVFAPHHGWAIRKAVGAGMYALPTRPQLMKKLNEDGGVHFLNQFFLPKLYFGDSCACSMDYKMLLKIIFDLFF